MQTLATLARHITTWIIGLLVGWLTLQLTSPDELKTATDAANALVEPLVILLGTVAVILSRLAMPFFDKIFRRGAGEDSSGPSGGTALLVVGLGMSMAVAGSLPSCAPITGSVAYTHPETGAEVRVNYQPSATK